MSNYHIHYKLVDYFEALGDDNLECKSYVVEFNENEEQLNFFYKGKMLNKHEYEVEMNRIEMIKEL